MEFTIFDWIIVAAIIVVTFIWEIIRHKHKADAEYKKFCEEFWG